MDRQEFEAAKPVRYFICKLCKDKDAPGQGIVSVAPLSTRSPINATQSRSEVMQIREPDEYSSENSSTSDDDQQTARKKSTRNLTTVFDNISSQPHVPGPSTSRGDTDHIPADHYVVKKVLDHRTIGDRRQFFLLWEDGSSSWTDESDCEGCVILIRRYCTKKRIEQTKLPIPAGGFLGRGKIIRENWVSADGVLDKVFIYGKKDAIQPQKFEQQQDHDALYLVQIGNHFFVVLHYFEEKLALVSDGLNSLETDQYAKDLLLDDFSGNELRQVLFFGQNQDNKCGSAAAAIMLEFQKAHKKREIPQELRPEKAFLKTVSKVLHKVESENLIGWRSIQERTVGITCPKCKRTWRLAKSKATLNFHRC